MFKNQNVELFELTLKPRNPDLVSKDHNFSGTQPPSLNSKENLYSVEEKREISFVGNKIKN